MSKEKAIVIGAGFGGLATAIRLQAQGLDVTLLEKRDKLGGRAYVYQDQGFTFDAGPTVITAPTCLEELFTVAGKRMEDYVELLPVEPMYRLCWEDGTRFDYTGELESTLEQIRRLCPEDEQGYRAFLEYTREVFDEGYTKLAHVPFLNWSSMVKVSPQLLRLKAYRSVYSIVSRYLRDPHLREAFSFHSLLVGGNPFETSSIYTLIHFLERKWGVSFPKGGTGALVQGLGRLFQNLGGTIQLGAETDRIAVEKGEVRGVHTKSGQFHPASRVVSNADVHETYTKLLKDEPRVKTTRWFVKNARYSMSLFVMYFGTRKRYPELAHHNILFGRRYKELLNDIFHKGILADDFSLYLHAPSLTDPSLAPDGCEAFYVLSPVPHLGKAPLDWSVEGPKYAERILGYLEKHYLPGLKENLVTQRIFTPADFRTELNAHLGSAFSLEPILRQSAYFRVHNRDSHLKGLYFAGAGTHPGAGIPGVVNSAKATAGLVLEDVRAGQAQASKQPDLATALSHCKQSIRVGSLSFSLASRLFARGQREAACFLYGWCRYCDDQVDETMNLRLQEERVARLKEQTLAAFDGRPGDNPVFVALAHVARQYQIPSHYATELLEGMAMDVAKERYWTQEELGLYAYRVAGTVGLMLSHAMGVSDPKALKHAADLGSAMQLTNIARDVHEDAWRKRVYLPLQWLDEAGIPAAQITNPRYQQALSTVVARLLDDADVLYASGIQGLRYLSLRSALAVALATCVYREIGVKVRARGPKAWERRVVVPLHRKLALLWRACGMVLATVPARLRKPFRPVALESVWRHA